MLFQPTIADVPAIAKLLRKKNDEIACDLPLFIIVKEDDAVIGCVRYCVIGDSTARIYNLHVRKDKRKVGYGDFLMREVAHEIGKFGIKKITVYTSIPSFFGQYGFKRIRKGAGRSWSMVNDLYKN
jgi:N-acetylglutamate synthase-like GNAT family acetyltransferase